jgi:DNA replication protein DnaC
VSADATNAATLERSCAWCDAPATHGQWCEPHLAEIRERERRTAEDEVRRRRTEFLEAIGVPVRLQASTFATSTATKPLELVRAFRDNGRGRLLGLLGPTGVGKSWACAALINDVLSDLRTSQRWMLCSTLLRELSDYKLSDAAIARACSGRLLVLDDFQPPPSPEMASAVEEILVRREQNGLEVVITSNLRREQLEAVLSDRLLDRFRAWGELHEVRGRSLRG